MTQTLGIKRSLTISVSVTALWFLMSWRYGIDFADEGYYWYGAQRLMQGQVPIRDFMAYDPGRYVWAATIMSAIGRDGLFEVRLAAYLYQWLGIWLALQLAVKSCETGIQGREKYWNWVFLTLIAGLLLLTSFPYYKSFDHVSCIALIAMSACMLRSQEATTWLLGGFTVGVLALIGRNHGVYGVFCALVVGLIVLRRKISWTKLLRLAVVWVAGVALGFLPILLGCLLFPSFRSAFIESILWQIRAGNTNVSIEVPWPWSLKRLGLWNDVSSTLDITQALATATSLGFVTLVAFLGFGVLERLRRINYLKGWRECIWTSCVIVSFPYAHYAFSRADAVHLALGFVPVLFGILILASGRSSKFGVLFAILVFLPVFATFGVRHYSVRHYINPSNYDNVTIDGQIFKVRQKEKAVLENSRSILVEYQAENSFLAWPDLVTVHAVERHPMPVWEIYPLVPREPTFEIAEISRIEKHSPKIIFLSNHALDGNPDQTFERMHPLTWSYINLHYRAVNQLPETQILVYERFQVRN